jgi:hypothetical protein
MKTLIKLTVLAMLIACIFSGCKKKSEDQLPPAINFKVGSGYTQNNDTIAVGHKLHFGIQARGTSENITNFTIKKVLENGTVITVMDTGMNAEAMDIDKIYYQNVEEKATWTFSVMDRNRMSAQITMVVFKDPNSAFGGIFYYPGIKLGFQNNTTFSHYLDLYTGLVYPNDSATAHQNLVNMLCYYNASDGPVLSSPGEMDNFGTDAQIYCPIIVNWTTRNYTKWDISIDNGTNTPLTAADFNSAQNDSLLIIAYHDVWGKKKFKFATAGKIVPFLTNTGKKGLMKVNDAVSAEDGYLDVDVKIQQ